MTTARDSLNALNVSKSFPGSRALDSLALTVKAGEIHALVGENGSGKSTFIKILSGYHTPDRGATIAVAGQNLEFGDPSYSYSVGVRVVHQDLGLIDSLSVMDNLSLNTGFETRMGTIKSSYERQRALVDLERLKLDVSPRALVSTLTPALRTGVAVARALRHDPRSPESLLILDEPTATLPVAEVRHLLEIVRSVARQGIGVLYVTHRLDEVFDLAAQITVLRDGKRVTTQPSTSLDHRSLIELLVGRDLGDFMVHRDRGDSMVRTVSSHSQQAKPLLSVKQIWGGTVIDIGFDVRAGEIVGIAGITGSGRESLLPTIFGALPRSHGMVEIGGTAVPSFRPHRSIRLGAAYLPPDRKTQGGVMDISARENITLTGLGEHWRGLRLRSKSERAEAERWFSLLQIRPAANLDRPLLTFSGGNQQKVLFAKWLRCMPRVLLLDEPTQGVDVQTKANLHQQILNVAAKGCAVLVSSADLDELQALCHRVLVLRNGTVATELSGPDLTIPAMTRAVLGGEASSTHVIS
jgi:ribose transport system ATP-binding protein